MTNEYNSISDQASSGNSSSSGGGIQILTSSSYLDHVYTYFGQNYSPRHSSLLHELNSLSRRNGLLLHRSQSTSRDVRILLPTQIEIALEHNHQTPIKQTRFNIDQQNSQVVDENDDDALILGEVNCYPKPDTNYRRFENKNYQTFLYNFNKIAAGCYLKVMQAPQDLWQLYSLDKHVQAETNFNL